jgi:hypothetical protein
MTRVSFTKKDQISNVGNYFVQKESIKYMSGCIVCFLVYKSNLSQQHWRTSKIGSFGKKNPVNKSPKESVKESSKSFLSKTAVWTLNIMSIRGLLSSVSFLNGLEMVSQSANHAAKLVDKLLTAKAHLFFGNQFTLPRCDPHNGSNVVSLFHCWNVSCDAEEIT